MSADNLAFTAQTQTITDINVQVVGSLNVDYGANTVGGTLTLSGNGHDYPLSQLTLTNNDGDYVITGKYSSDETVTISYSGQARFSRLRNYYIDRSGKRSYFISASDVNIDPVFRIGRSHSHAGWRCGRRDFEGRR